MPQITDIIPQKRKDRLNIFIDYRFAIGLAKIAVLKYGLEVGKNLRQNQIETIIKKEELTKFQDSAMRFLNWRPRSEKEVRDYLAKKIAQKENIKFRQARDSSIIDKIITKLKKYKFIDDRQFAKWFVDSRVRLHSRSTRLIAVELAQKGIDKNIIDELLSHTIDELALAKRAVQKKIKNWQKLPDLEFKKKLYQFLISRGFGYDTAKDTFAYFAKKS